MKSIIYEPVLFQNSSLKARTKGVDGVSNAGSKKALAFTPPTNLYRGTKRSKKEEEKESSTETLAEYARTKLDKGMERL